MEFRIADSFADSLAKLTGQEQKAVKTTAFDLQMNPAGPSLQFHRIDRSKDPNFWSLRVNRDIRMIVHKTASSILLCYVDHHDDAYAWAERRKLERHPRTGAAQLVELRERVEEIVVQRPAPADEPVVEALPLFAAVPEEDLLSYGVPPEWLEAVRGATEETLFDIADHLPQEAAEALLDLATGVTPICEMALPEDADPFSHPDAQRRFRVLTDIEELERALDYPWEKWTVFLHPAQRRFVEQDYSGPARITGSAGTGKTIVALHRAVFLARQHPQARILLTTFSKALAQALRTKLGRLVGKDAEVTDRIVIRPITGIGYELYAESFGQAQLAPPDLIRSLLRDAAAGGGDHRFTPTFLFAEWTDVVDAWQLKSWEAYRDVARLGRKTRIGGKQREVLWSIFESVGAVLERRKLETWSGLLHRVTEGLQAAEARPFDFAVVDEAQDIGIAELRFLAALGKGGRNSLFFVGDLGQRIFQQPFSWLSLGVDVRGRSHRLRVNYRTSHQIRSQADRLLPSSIADVDGIVEERRGTVSVFNGPAPEIQVFEDQEQETEAVGRWIAKRIAEGLSPQEIGVFVRAEPQLKRARAAVKASGAKAIELGDRAETAADRVSLSTMHLAKGLEFRAVVVMACDDEVVPLQERIENVSDDSDLEEVYNTERHLLYVACTRARDHLLVTGVEPASEFLDDLRQ